MSELVLLDGDLLQLAEAHISPLDRGFLFGDGVYEVVRVRDGQALFLERHLLRLARSLAAVEIAEPAGIADGCARLLAATALRDGSLYLQITRGAGRRSHLPDPAMRPTWLVMPGTQPALTYGTSPLHTVTCEDPRWQRCDVKSISLMGTVMGKLRARAAGADEVLFLGPGGVLREGGSTAVFVRDGDGLHTHPLDGHVLPSITRERVLAAALSLGLPCVERGPALALRGSWREAFLCGTLTGLQAIATLDGVAIGDGTAGEWTSRLAAALQTEEDALREVRR